jgi:hypothetical protein
MEKQTAVCRGCGMALKGKPYHLGGNAYHPETNEQCPVNHYGGFVCSYDCDWKVSVDMLNSMPGCSGAAAPDCYAAKKIRDNWRQA